MANISLEDGAILVLGGTGKTGRRVAELLRQAGHAVRIGSRASEMPFNWEDHGTWEPILHGVRRSTSHTSPIWQCRAPAKPSRRFSTGR
jgi:uncharacterized protein YbjT (DUF2867 family)